MKIILTSFLFIIISTSSVCQKIKKIIDKNDPYKMQTYLDKGGDINETIFIKNSNVKDNSRHPLIYALGTNNINVFDILLENKDKFDDPVKRISEAFIFSLSLDDNEISKRLFNSGIDVDINGHCVPCHEHNAIMVAAYYGKEDWYFLLKPKSDLFFVSNTGHNLAHLAANGPSYIIAEDVFSIEGIDLNLKNDVSETPLDYTAASENNYELFNLLLEKGADINKAWNIVYNASFSFNPDCFTEEILTIRLGDFWKADDNNYIPLGVAASFDNTDYEIIYSGDETQIDYIRLIISWMTYEVKQNEASNYKESFFQNSFIHNNILFSSTILDYSLDDIDNIYGQYIQFIALIRSYGKEFPVTKKEYKYACKLYGSDLVNELYDRFEITSE